MRHMHCKLQSMPGMAKKLENLGCQEEARHPR